MSENRIDVMRPDEQAASWFARRSGDAFDAQDEVRFQAWLAADPANAQAFADLQLLWQDMAHLPRPRACVTRRLRRPRWRSLAVAACLGLLALLPVWLDGPQDVELTLVSGSTEPREVTLGDGSHIHLNRNTRLEVRLLPDRREVELLQGQAYFSVARDEQRPFHVQVGEGSVTVLGTRFDVRRGSEHLIVTVEQGRVALRPQEGAVLTELLAGDRAVYEQARGELLRSRVAEDEVASWRSGRLLFQQLPLAQLLDELSQYRTAPVSLGDASLANRQVSGSVDLARPDDFLAALPVMLPVALERSDDGSVRVVKAKD
ncbi:FecR family protein [Ectopseudomonas alcaliphila]|uniref:FecR domain-containing protein n=1 Tax=Ectopseudomonas alcaliphila TaxID=101564 RepID=A0A1G6TI24_9GAMM|nr:FecR domain-containing protein [Pseudomonas alcaliphila]MDX5991281.1 FecR domain-containing protein [Pseudomonas alcaliphila]SDD28077.1 FecR family protein [Pseudomonas alcaliphila]